jgi:hypothetical protein
MGCYREARSEGLGLHFFRLQRREKATMKTIGIILLMCAAALRRHDRAVLAAWTAQQSVFWDGRD